MDSAAQTTRSATRTGAFTGPTASRAPQQRGAFPLDAVAWLVGGEPDQFVVSVGSRHPAHDATATALHLADHRVVASTGALPFPHGAADAVVSSGRLPDLEGAARVLRPGGWFSLVCHRRDHRIPWARRFDALLGADIDDDPAVDLELCRRFGFVEEARFRYWQRLDAAALVDLVRVELADRDEERREEVVAAALGLYEEYQRGPDGLRMPWLSHCYRARLVDAPPEPRPEPEPLALTSDAAAPGFVFHAADGDRAGVPALIDLR